MMERVFGWVFAALGVCALVGVVFYGASWHWFAVGACMLLAWLCFAEAREEARKKA